MEIDGVIENDNGGEPVGDTALMKKSIGNSKMNLHLYRKKSGRNRYIHKNIYPSLSVKTYNFRKIYKIHCIRIQKCKKHTHDIKCRIKPIHLFSP